MNGLIQIMNGLGANALPVFLNVVWQCSAIFLVAFAAIKLCRPRSPLTRHLVWLLALVGMAACPLVMLTGQTGSFQLVRVPLAIDAPGSAVQALAHSAAGENDAVSVDQYPAVAGMSHEVLPAEAAATTPDDLAGAATLDASDRARLDEHRVGPLTASTDGKGTYPAGAVGVAGQPNQASGVQWPALALAVWAAGALLLLGRFLVAQFAVRRLIGRSAPARRASLLRAFESAKALVGVRGNVALRVSSELAVPVAAGVFRPCVLFPEALVEQLSETELQAVAVHELTHVKRMDTAVMVLERLVQAVLFFHPAVWLTGRALSAAREESCDEAVVRATDRPIAYAKCLTSLFEHVRVLSHCRVASVGVAHYRSKLRQRVETLLSGRMLLLGRVPHGVKAAVIGAACVALVLIGGTTFVRAQATDEAGGVEATVVDEKALGSYRWVDCSPGGGVIESLTMCTRKPDVLYAATSNGVFKTTDGAATWTPTAPRSDDGVRREAADVAVDCADPDVVYNASGWLNKSTDGGESWDLLPVDGGGGRIATVETDPQNPDTLYVCDRARGVFKSTDGGETWQSKSDGLEDFDVWRFEVDPHVPQALYCVSGNGVYVTTDGADTWHTVKLPFRGTWNLKAIRAGGDDGDLLYVGTWEDVYYYSENGGETWEHLYSAEDDPDGEQTATIKELRKRFLYGLPGMRRQSTWHGGPVIVHPKNPDVVYRIERAQGTLLKTEDFGEHWTAATAGITGFEARSIACSYATPGLVYVAGRGGVYQSRDGGKTWKQMCADNWSGPPLVIHPLDPQTLLIATGDDRARISTDGGKTWEQIIESGIDGFVFDPEDEDTFYVLCREGILKTVDHGETWESTGGTIEMTRRGGDWQGTTQSNADIIYAIADRSRLLRSTDVGQSWQEVMDLGEGEAIWIRFADVHPTDPKVVIVSEWNGPLYLTRDAGKTWRAVEIPGADDHTRPRCIGFDPDDSDVFYVGCDGRATVLRTRDGGATFEVLKSGLLGERVVQIAVSPADGAVYAGTADAGLFKLESEQPASDKGGDK